MDFLVTVLVIVLNGFMTSGTKRNHIVHWNKSNPMFRIDNTDNIIDVNVDNLRWEYDQANFICPSVTKSGNPNEEPEKYIIYNVSKEEYDSCMVKLLSVIHSDQMTRIVTLVNSTLFGTYKNLTCRVPAKIYCSAKKFTHSNT